MASVTAQVAGSSDRKGYNATTIADLKKQIGPEVANYQATVNGEAQEDTYSLSDYEFVALTVKVKGA